MSSKKRVIDTYYMVRDAAVRRYICQDFIRIAYAASRISGTRYASVSEAAAARDCFIKQWRDPCQVLPTPNCVKHRLLKIVKVTVRQ
jgi:hypothetical protein